MQDLVNLAMKAARLAGDEILSIKHPLISTKADGSYITSADLKSNEIICDILNDSKINICSEEQTLSYEKRQKAAFWLIDPLDGTSNYIKNKNNFCICISLIEDKRPVLGLIYDVCNKNIYYSAKKLPVYKNHEILTPPKKDSNNALVSLRNRQNPLNKELVIKHDFKTKSIGSALKFCALLEGEADVYLRFEELNSWDISAGDFLINQNGGLMIGLDKKYINYNKQNFSSRPFIAFSKV